MKKVLSVMLAVVMLCLTAAVPALAAESGEAVSAFEMTDPVKINSDVLSGYSYSTYYTAQNADVIVCEKRGSVFFAGSQGLNELNLQSGECKKIDSFSTIGYYYAAKCYANDKIYLAYKDSSVCCIKVFNLLTLSYEEPISFSCEKFEAIGVDAKGRIYVSAIDADSGRYIYLLDKSGSVLSKAAVEQARAESRRATESALEGQRKLKRELEDLRRRKKRLENEINMVAASGRGMKRHEINMLNNEILRMEREYDGLRVSRAVSRDVQVSEEKARQAQLSADSRRTRANYEFDKTVSAVSSAEVVSGFEDGTVLALEKAIADSLSSAAARRDRIARAADYVKAKGDVKNSISSSTLQEIKADIDAYVAAALKDPK